jgi:thiosulfate/3-mercaptopyruvate sulfurtransferase
MKLFYTFFLTFIFINPIFANTINKEGALLPAIVPINWLQENMQNEKLVIIDLRPESEYIKGHINNSINIPALANLFDEKFMIPKLDFLKELFSQAGINKDSLVVAYDNGEFIWAARFYWILETLGHKNVGLLKYGYGSKLKNEFTISTKNFKATPKEFIPRVDNEKIQTKLSTLLSLNKKTIIDGRNSSHYNGEKSIAKRFGHIPSAKNYECTNNLQVNEDGNKMKDLQTLKNIYKDVPKDKEVILYCDGGAEAALNYVVLQELGYKVSIYDGSWSEWGNDESLPIINPSSK